VTHHDTYKSHREYAFKRATEAFADHIVTTICDSNDVKVFKCARPKSWTYGFLVSFLPGAILIHGDVGDLLIDRPSGGYEWMRDAIDSMDYVLGKSSMAKLDTFMPGDALALLNDPEWRDAKTREQIRDRWDVERDTDGEEWREIVYDVTGDFEAEPCRYYSFTTLFCFAAAQWFFANVGKAEVAA
jgi:hypothetical protein